MKLLENYSLFLSLFLTLATAQIDESVVSKPRARLYTGLSFTGNSVDFNPKAKPRPKCLTLSKSMRGSINSVNTFGTCVRLYDDTHCWQQSMAFYPRSIENPLATKFLQDVKSIGPCFDNELVESQEINSTFTKKRANNTLLIVPDFVIFGSTGTYNDTGSSPINYYRTGHNGRLEYVRAIIRPRHLNDKETMAITKDDQDFYAALEKEEGDEIGYFVGSKLGPQSSLPFHNVFPQNVRNREGMRELERVIVDKVGETKKEVYLYVNVDYLGMSGRPTGMNYVIEFNNKILRMKYLTNLKY